MQEQPTYYRKNAFTFAFIVAIGGFVFGLDAALISGTIKFITQEFSLSDWQLGTAVSAPGLGVLFALPFAGYASNGLGRKQTLQIIAMLYLVSAVGSALAPNYWTLVAARFLGGLAFTSITMASMYIGEIAPSAYRGKLVSMIQINIVLGLSLAYFINNFILQATEAEAVWAEALGISQYTWRWMLGTEILPAFIWLMLLLFIPKSPYWLLYQNRREEAKETLSKILPADQIPAKIQEIENSLVEDAGQVSIGKQLQEIFDKRLRTIFIIALTIAIAQQSTGINAILFYAPTVIEQIGIGTNAAYQQAVWIGLISVVFTVLSLLLIDRVGRRPMILYGMLWIIASLTICSIGFNNARYTLKADAIEEMEELPNADRLTPLINVEFRTDIKFKQALQEHLGESDARTYSSLLLQKAASMNGLLIFIGILSFIAAFQFSVGPIMWVLFSEIFPASLRGVAIPFFALVTSVTSYLVQQFFPWQLSNLGASSIFLFYASTVAIGLIILYFFLPETKNLTIEEIVLAMKKKAA